MNTTTKNKEIIKHEENMLGWRRAAQSKGIKLNATIETNRIEELQKLMQTNLPTYDYHIMSLTEFYKNPNKIKDLFKKYNDQIVIRAIPLNNCNQRLTSIGKTLEETISEFTHKISQNNIKNYQIVINSYDPAKYCGVIISNPHSLTIEMVEEPNLENICHGHVIPWSAEFNPEFIGAPRLMRYRNIKSEKIREIMWNVIKSISTLKHDVGLPMYKPRQGYFEFVISQKNNQLKFIDYRPVV